MRGIYAAECALLVLLTSFRYFAWSSQEERRMIASILAFLVAYMPVELGMDYATLRWNLQAWATSSICCGSIPFCVAAGLALISALTQEQQQRVHTERVRVWLGSRSRRFLLSAGVFTRSPPPSRCAFRFWR